MRLALLVLLAVTVLSSQVPKVPEPQLFLQKQLGFTQYELGQLEKGQIIVKFPKTAEPREVAVFAIMRLDVPEEFFLEKMRDIINFKKSDNVLQIGKFSDPPRLDDLAGLTLDPAEIESLRRCRVNSCDFKMSAHFIERFRKEVNWSAPDYRDRVTSLVRQMLLEQVQTYLAGGIPALGEYNDKSYPVRVPEEFRSILQTAPYIYGYVPEFQKYLEEFPKSNPGQAENFVYWSKDKFGLKAVVTVTHITAYRVNGPDGPNVMIASKGIYANHYFEASLGLTAFIHNQTSDPPRTYLIYINRSKIDALRGLFAGLKRSLISGSLRDGAAKSMEMTKTKLEGAYRKK